MTGTASVVVLNRDRLASLAKTVRALQQQTRRDFDLTVVTNQAARITGALPGLAAARVVPFEAANVAAARNAGIAACGGDIIAFCDDDAVPEPTWLARLTSGLEDPQIGGVGGLVRGRNGVSVQWGPQEVDRYGNDWPLPPSATTATTPGRVLKAVGTNCAFRRAALAEVGGFDATYRFFLDETDVCWRLAAAGWGLRFVADAEVHHGYCKSAYRTAERAPRSLFEIGASKAAFCARFGDPDSIETELRGFAAAQRVRLLKAMHLGLMEPGQVAPVLASLHAGYAAGRTRTRDLPATLDGAPGQPFAHGPKPAASVLSSGVIGRRARRRAARALAQSGAVATLLTHSPTALMMTVRFTEDGYWQHRGGIFGRTARTEPLFRLRRRKDWIAREILRIGNLRG